MADPAPAPPDDASTLPPRPRPHGAPVVAVSRAAANGFPEVSGYEVLGELGRGGMGVVYKARQTALDRLVALKMVLGAAPAGPAELAQFRAEAEAVAQLHHPNIVQIYDIDEQCGRPYFSLEYVEGGSLADRLQGTPAPPRCAARFAETLARAVQAAHAKGIVHRDLKPANVLLSAAPDTKSDGQGTAAADIAGPFDLDAWTPKIADFGLAKRLTKEVGAEWWPGSGAVGTPSYMAPEQAAGRRDVGPPADIYALGAILYELLTGRPPFRAANPADTVLQVIGEEPVPPSRLNTRVPRDLETICLKCLEKLPKKRYATAGALADELRRYLDHKPILARPTPFWERGWKWARRRPGAAATVGVVIVLAGLGVADAVRRWERRHAGQLSAVRDENERELYFAHVALADRALAQGRPDKARDCLDACPQTLRNWEWRYLRGRCAGGVATLPAAGGAAVAWQPDGSRLAVASIDTRSVTVYDPDGGQQTLTVPDAGPGIAFSPDGTWLAVGDRRGGMVRVVDAKTGDDRRLLPGKGGSVWGVAFSPDGTLLAAAGEDGKVRLCEQATGREQRTLVMPAGGVTSIAFGDGGRLIGAACGHDIQVWEAATGKEVFARTQLSSEKTISIGIDARELSGARAERVKARTLGPIAFAPDGKSVAFAEGSAIHVHDLRQTPPAEGPGRVLEGHTGSVHSIAFTPDGRRLASAGADHTVRLWSIERACQLAAWHGHIESVNGVAFRPDGMRLVSVGLERVVVWDAAAPPDVFPVPADPAYAISPNGTRVAAGDPLRLWDRTGLRGMNLQGQGSEPDSSARRVAFSPDCSILAGVVGRKVELWDVPSGRLVRTIRNSGRGSLVAFDGDGSRLGVAGEHEIRLFETASGRELHALTGLPHRVDCFAFRPDTEDIAVGGEGGRLQIWTPGKGDESLCLGGHSEAVVAVSFSPKGRRLASAGLDGTVRVWDVETRQQMRELRVPGDRATAIAFSPDGTRLAGAGEGGVQLWDATTGHEILTLPTSGGAIGSMTFSRDGRLLLALDADGLLRVWTAAGDAPDLPPAGARGLGRSVEED